VVDDAADAAEDPPQVWRTMLRGIGPLLGSAHILPSLAVTSAATALAFAAGLTTRAPLVTLAVGTGQLSIGWSNDWLDWRRDLVAGRTDKPLAQGSITPRAVAVAAALALAACVVVSLALGWTAGMIHLVAVAAGWAYNVRAKHTWYSVAPWALAFGLLPAVVTLTEPSGRWPAWWLLAAGALVGAGAHFANAIPDLDDDRSTGVHGLPHRLGRRGALAAAVALVAAGHAVIAVGTGRYGGGVLGMLIVAGGVAALAAIVVVVARGHERAAFRAVVLLLLLLAVSVLVAGADPWR
jgi:4-hydroxybenzoate polyprenyltransferase